MRSSDPRVDALLDLARQMPGGLVKPPPMRLIRKGGFGTYKVTLVDADNLPPYPDERGFWERVWAFIRTGKWAA